LPGLPYEKEAQAADRGCGQRAWVDGLL